MSDAQFASTSLTLLGRLQEAPRDEAAWADFVKGYAPTIGRWCRVWGLQSADVDDVTQVVLLKMARTMTTFRYDPSRSFRAYLKALTGFAVKDALATIRSRETTTISPEMAAWLAVDDTGHDLARWVEAELRGELFREAAAKVAGRIDPRTWQAFNLLAMERKTGQEVADRLGMSVAAVYMAKSRVLKMMRREVRALTRPLSEPVSRPDPPNTGAGTT